MTGPRCARSLACRLLIPMRLCVQRTNRRSMHFAGGPDAFPAPGSGAFCTLIQHGKTVCSALSSEICRAVGPDREGGAGIHLRVVNLEVVAFQPGPAASGPRVSAYHGIPRGGRVGRPHGPRRTAIRADRSGLSGCRGREVRGGAAIALPGAAAAAQPAGTVATIEGRAEKPASHAANAGWPARQSRGPWRKSR